MKNKLSAGRVGAAVLIAALAVWRLSDVVTMPSSPWVYWPLAVALFAAFTALSMLAFANRDRRLAWVSYPCGFLFACFAVLGKPISQNHTLPTDTMWTLAGMFLSVAVFAALFGAVIMLAYRAALRWLSRPAKISEKESDVSRLTGNWLFAFFVLMLCWVPVWLAFYPGTFRYDADTQFFSYMDGMLTTHHPLLHTLLMSWILDLGNTLDSLTLGVALYDGLQLALTAAILAYACVWLRRRGAPTTLRVAVLALFALLPLYPLWAFSATKDVLFGGFVLLLCLQMVDLWRDGAVWFRSPVRVGLFALTAVLMMLLRNNGVYAFCLALPFAVLIAKGRRARTALLFAVCVALYLGANQLLMTACDAEGGSTVEMLSIPLQQTMRAATRGTVSDDDREMLSELFWEYEGDWADLYTPLCADNVKWNLDEDVLSADPGGYLALWARVGRQNPRLYLEAFLEQNLPYFYPGAKMEYNIVLGQLPMDLYTLEEHSLLPGLKPFYQAYDKTLTVFGLPGTQFLSDNAVMVWLTLLLTGFALYRKQRGAVIAALFLLAIWCTCLMGPIAVMRYLLGFFYTTPVLLAAAFARSPRDKAVAARQSAAIPAAQKAA